MNLKKILNRKENKHTLRKKVLNSNIIIIKNTFNNYKNKESIRELLISILQKEKNYLTVGKDKIIKINIFIGYKDASISSKYTINFKDEVTIISRALKLVLEKINISSKDKILSYITLVIEKQTNKKRILPILKKLIYKKPINYNFKELRKLGGQYAK